MGSRVYAARCREHGERIVAMLSLETVGWYTDEPGSQHYPFPFGLFYPERGNFIAFVSDLKSRPLLRRVTALFRKHSTFPCERAGIPGWVTGAGWSDHWSFWQEGYQGVMVTDTAPFRYPHYHSSEDTPDKLDYDSTAKVVEGLTAVVAGLAGVGLE